MKTRYMSYVALGLMANLIWAPSVNHQLAYAEPPQVAAPQPLDTLSDLARIEATQRGAFERLFANPYRGIADSMLMVDDEITTPADPNIIYTGRRTLDPNSEGFTFTITNLTQVPMDDYGIGAVAHLIEGVAEGIDEIVFRGFTLQLTNPNAPQRLRGLMILNWEPLRLPQQINCGGPSDLLNYRRCITDAQNAKVACEKKAWRKFTNRLLGKAGLGGFLGSIAGCAAKRLQAAGVGAVVAWKQLLAWCAVGALVGALLAIYNEYLEYRSNVYACQLDYLVESLKCYNKYCVASEDDLAHLVP